EVETRNWADNLAYTAEKTIREQGDQVPDDVKNEVQEKVSTLRNALNGNDIEQIKNAAEDLSNSVQKMGSAFYQQQQGGGPARGEGEDEGTVEGDFREV
ncbi:MAG: Hsp70 family protein, partial [Dehalococcoidia bacterium]